MFSHKRQNEFIERLQLTAHTYIDTYVYTLTPVRARALAHTHTHTKEKQIKQAVLLYAQIFRLRPSSGYRRGGGGDRLTRNFVTHVIVEKRASFSVVIRKRGREGGQTEKGDRASVGSEIFALLPSWLWK